MTLIHSLFLGLIQGLSEFLPISSSGHLILMPRIFGWSDQGLAFDVVLHLATALAIIIVLRKDILGLLKGIGFSSSQESRAANFKLLKLIIIAVIPAGLAGYILDNWVAVNLRQTQIVAISMIFWAIVLFWAERYSDHLADKTTHLKKINFKQALYVGLMQVIALIPGTSRSGITITAGLLGKIDRQTAVKFSFLVGLPLILAAGGLKFLELIHSGIDYFVLTHLAVGFFSAMISGIFAIRCLLWLARQSSFKIFVIYRLVLAVIILLI